MFVLRAALLACARLGKLEAYIAKAIWPLLQCEGQAGRYELVSRTKKGRYELGSRRQKAKGPCADFDGLVDLTRYRIVCQAVYWCLEFFYVS